MEVGEIVKSVEESFSKNNCISIEFIEKKDKLINNNIELIYQLFKRGYDCNITFDCLRNYKIYIMKVLD